MLLTLLKGKIHRATVTQCDLHYEGSISVDAALLERAGILDLGIEGTMYAGAFAGFLVPLIGSVALFIDGSTDPDEGPDGRPMIDDDFFVLLAQGVQLVVQVHDLQLGAQVDDIVVLGVLAVLQGLADHGHEVLGAARGGAELLQALLDQRAVARGLEGGQALELLALGLGVDAQQVRHLELVLDVLVDADDPAFTDPAKFIGPVYDEQRAREIGLVNEVVALADLHAVAQAMAESIAANAPLTVRAAKKMMDTAKACRKFIDAAPANVGKQSFGAVVNGFTGSSIWHSISPRLFRGLKSTFGPEDTISSGGVIAAISHREYRPGYSYPEER